MPNQPFRTFSQEELLPATRADLAVETNIRLVSGVYEAGSPLKPTGTPGLYGLYESATGADTFGRLLLRRACTVDDSNNITIPGEHGVTRKYAPAYMRGIFNVADLPETINADDLLAASVPVVNGQILL